MNKAIFFDRDGVLNELIQRDGGFYSPQSFDQFIILDSAVGIIKNVKKLGYLCVVISNQPDISRGYLKQTELDKMTDVLYKELYIDDVFYCFHAEKMCDCRKPLPGLIYSAQSKWNIDLTKSVMVGDTEKDSGAARNAGVKFYLLDHIYNINIEATNRIKKLQSILPLI